MKTELSLVLAFAILLTHPSALAQTSVHDLSYSMGFEHGQKVRNAKESVDQSAFQVGVDDGYANRPSRMPTNELVAAVKRLQARQSSESSARGSTPIGDVPELSYYFGYDLIQNLKSSKEIFDPRAISKGFSDGYANLSPAVPLEVQKRERDAFLARTTGRQQRDFSAEASDSKQRSEQYLSYYATQPGAQKLTDGIYYRVLREGSGAPSAVGSNVNFEVAGPYPFGERKNEAAPNRTSIAVGSASLKGINTVMSSMPRGSVWEIVLSPDVAYGADPKSGFPPNTAVMFVLAIDTTIEESPAALAGRQAGAAAGSAIKQGSARGAGKPTRSTSSSPTWAQILTDGAANIAAAKAGTQAPSLTQSPYTSSRSQSATSAQSNFRAPLAPASCATYRATRYEPLWDSAAVEWRNVCNFPIEVHWCWVKPGQTTCKTDNAGSTLSPGETDLAVGPTGVAQPVAAYYVCNMSDSSKLCSGD